MQWNSRTYSNDVCTVCEREEEEEMVRGDETWSNPTRLTIYIRVKTCK